jgi:hypothetical protein
MFNIFKFKKISYFINLFLNFSINIKVALGNIDINSKEKTFSAK